jgi:hypothetical protein
MLIRLGPNNYDSSRYVKMKRKGDRLAIWMQSPAEVVKVEGADEVDAAIVEVVAAMEARDAEILGGGWLNLGGWSDDE